MNASQPDSASGGPETKPGVMDSGELPKRKMSAFTIERLVNNVCENIMPKFNTGSADPAILFSNQQQQMDVEESARTQAAHINTPRSHNPEVNPFQVDLPRNPISLPTPGQQRLHQGFNPFENGQIYPGGQLQLPTISNDRRTGSPRSTAGKRASGDKESKEWSSSCRICMEPFRINRLSREPLVGPCGHSFCRICVENLRGKCPLCRQQFRIAVKNFALIDVLAKYGPMEKRLRLQNQQMRKKLKELGVDMAADSDDSEDGYEADAEDRNGGNRKNPENRVLAVAGNPVRYQQVGDWNWFHFPPGVGQDFLRHVLQADSIEHQIRFNAPSMRTSAPVDNRNSKH